TIELLATEGFDALSIEGVAARARVGKTTVYRRWPSKVPLVVDAIRHHKPQITTVIPQDMPTRDALARLLSEVVRAQGTKLADRILGGVVGAIARDPELAAAVRAGLVSERRCTIVSVVRRGVGRGGVGPVGA